MSEPTPFNIAFEIWWSSADTYGLTAACKWTAWNAWLHQERTLALAQSGRGEPASPLLPVLERDAERYRARRYTIYKDRLRIEMPQGKNWRPTTFEDFCAEYDAACDKEIEKQATEISRLKGEGRGNEHD